LRSPQSTDNFDIADFQFNLSQMDAAPGVAAGLSSARPSWDAGQAGRLYYETDTRRLIVWNGAAWADILQAAESFAGSMVSPTLPASMAPTTTYNYNFPTITLTRPQRLVGTLAVNWKVPENQNAYLSFKLYFNYGASSIQAHVADLDALMRDTGPTSSLNYGSTTVSLRTGSALPAGVTITPQFRVYSGSGNFAVPYLAMYSVAGTV
jgi:hypothetical protein